MEPDDTADKAASMDFRSKMAYFNSKNKAEQSSKASNEPGRNERPSPKPKETSRQEDERTSSPQMTSQETSEKRSPSADKSLRESLGHELHAKLDEVSIRRTSGWFLTDMEVFQRPLCLVSANESNTLTIETETLEQIQKIDWPMVIVSVVGLYRTGKSYLMNRLAESTEGFALGDTIESTTKGIWAWCKIHPKMSNTVLLLLDTEGLGDVDKGDPSHDNKIFTLATLLSNCLVYNMKGAFDQDAVNKLTFVTEMAKNIRYRGESSEDNTSLNLILPDFVLCLRDFSLKLSKGGKKITEDEYLETSIAEQKGKEDKFNKPRECIRKYFPMRKCFTMPVPGDGDVLENLETLQFHDLSAKFKEATTRFISFVYSKKPKELLTSKPVNGQMFAILTDRYVAAIRHGAVPDVDDAFLAVAKIENTRIEQEAVEIFSTQMQKVSLPVSAKQLEKYYTKAQQTALAHLRKNVVHDKNGQYETQAQMKMDNSWNTMKEDNSKKVRDMCDVKLQEAYTKTLSGKIDNEVYKVVGGYRMFQHDIEILKKDYVSTLRDFEEHEILWTWLGLVKSLKEKESDIMQSDETLSKKEKEDEKKRNEDKFKSILEDQQNAKKEALKEQKKEMEEHYDKLEKDRIKQLEDDKEKYKTFIENRLEREAAEKELNQYKKEREKRLKKDKEKAEKRLASLKKEQEKERAKWFGARMWNAFRNKSKVVDDYENECNDEGDDYKNECNDEGDDYENGRIDVDDAYENRCNDEVGDYKNECNDVVDEYWNECNDVVDDYENECNDEGDDYENECNDADDDYENGCNDVVDDYENE